MTHPQINRIAVSVIDKAASTGRAYALLMDRNSLRAIVRPATGAQLSRDLQTGRAGEMVGVYDEAALVHQISADIEAFLGVAA